MSLRPTSALYMPSFAERAALRLQKIRAERTDQTLVTVKPFTPHGPHQKQRAFLELDAQEALYGGAAGGGKSDAALMAALQYIDQPDYSALIMRAHEVDLFKNNSIGDRAVKWFEGTPAKWDAGLLGFRFPSGATISFGHLGSIKDREKWKGPDFQFICVEELTEWEEGDYIFLFSRLRSVNPKVPTRMRANTNPGGVGHGWVKRRFIDSAQQHGTGLLYEEWRKGQRLGSPVFESPPSTQVVEIARSLGVHPQGAHFVPAFASDNPKINQAEYLMNLAQLDSVQFAWYAKGDWNAVPSGKIFKREWFSESKYLKEPPADLKWMRYWDLAGTDPDLPENQGKDPAWSAGVKLALWPTDQGHIRLVVSDVRRVQLEPGDLESFVASTAKDDGRGVRIRFEREPGSSGKAVVRGYQTATLPEYDVDEHHKTGSKEEMWRPLAGLAKVGNVYLVDGEWTREFVDELVGLPKGKKDQADAAAGGYAKLLEERGSRYGSTDIAVNPDEGARPSDWREAE